MSACRGESPKTRKMGQRFVRWDKSIFIVIQQRTPLFCVTNDVSQIVHSHIFAVATGGAVVVTLSIIESFRVRRCFLRLLYFPAQQSLLDTHFSLYGILL